MTNSGQLLFERQKRRGFVVACWFGGFYRKEIRADGRPDIIDLARDERVQAYAIDTAVKLPSNPEAHMERGNLRIVSLAAILVPSLIPVVALKESIDNLRAGHGTERKGNRIRSLCDETLPRRGGYWRWSHTY